MALGDFFSQFDPTTQKGRIRLAGLTGAPGALWAKSKFNELDTQEQINKERESLEGGLKDMPEYQVPEETKRFLQLMEQSAQSLEQQKELSKEATDIARYRTGMTEAPGAGLAKESIRQSTAGTVQNILEAGGGSPRAIGAIAQAGQAEQGALTQQAIINEQYKDQAERDFMNALRTQAGFDAGITTQQAQMTGQGLQAMTGQIQQQYEYGLNKYLTGLDYNMMQLANKQQELENIRNRRAQIASSTISGASSIIPLL